MELSILDRLMIQSIIPSRGKIEDMIMRADILEKIKITQEEVEKFNIEENEKGVKWDKSGDEHKIEVEFTELEKMLLVSNLKKASDNQDLPAAAIGVYKKFVM